LFFSDGRASFIFIKRTTLVSSLESNYSPPSWGGVRGRGLLLITISLLGRDMGMRPLHALLLLCKAREKRGLLSIHLHEKTLIFAMKP
jgi:hypothetical protein